MNETPARDIVTIGSSRTRRVASITNNNNVLKKKKNSYKKNPVVVVTVVIIAVTAWLITDCYNIINIIMLVRDNSVKNDFRSAEFSASR